MILLKKNTFLVLFFVIWTLVISTTTVVAINGLTIADGPWDVHALIESTWNGYARLWFWQHGAWKWSVWLTSSWTLTMWLGNSDNDNVVVKANGVEFNAQNSNGSAFRLFDENKNLLGGLFSQRWTNEVIGILDGDNNYSYIARKDDRTDLRINNSNIFTAWSNGRVGARQYCDENGANCTPPGEIKFTWKWCADCPDGYEVIQRYPSGNPATRQCSWITGTSYVSWYRNAPICAIRGDRWDNDKINPYAAPRDIGSDETISTVFIYILP